MQKNLHFYRREGVLRDNRLIASTNSDYAKIDERNLEDMLVFSQILSKLLKFHNAENKSYSDFSFILKDELMVLSAISFYDLSKKESNFLTNIKNTLKFKRPLKKTKYLEKSIKELSEVVTIFNQWLVHLNESEQSNNSSSEIRNDLLVVVQNKLSEPAEEFKQLIDLAYKKQWITFDRKALKLEALNEKVWSPENSDAVSSSVSKINNIEEVSNSLKHIFQAFYEVIINTKNNTKEYIETSLQKDNHSPHMSLLLSFYGLYRYPQEALNDFMNRYLDYYFGKILGIYPKNEIKNKVYLNFSLNKQTDYAYIDENDRFFAGQNKRGEAILYKPEYSSTINNIKLKKIYTHYLPSLRLNSYGTANDIIENIYRQEIPMKIMAKKDSKVINKAYPSFGEKQEYLGSQDQAMPKASIGFMISSPAFYLNEGKRNIVLGIESEQKSFDDLSKIIEFSRRDSDDESKDNITKILSNLISLEITCEDGWKKISNFSIGMSNAGPIINIAFTMEKEDGKFVIYDPKIHDGNEIKAKHPVVRIMLNNNAYRYGYSFLSILKLTNIYISTTSIEIKNLKLYNNLGEINQGTPFLPFGPKPQKGSYMLIGCNEAFMKKLKKLRINMEWYNMPENSGGFYTNYKEYGIGIDNSSFDISISNLENGSWEPKKPQNFKLFRTANTGLEKNPEPKGYLINKSVFTELDIDKLKFVPDFKNIYTNNIYDHLSRKGFIKIELNSPKEGFAHDIYPSVLSNVSLHNAKLLKLNTTKEPPKEPYSPQLKSISIDYISETVIPLNNNSTSIESLNSIGEVFHVHPEGAQKVFPSEDRNSIKLLPKYEHEGSIMFGLEGLKPRQTVSLLFNMLNKSNSSSSTDDPPEISWAYLDKNKWYPISSSKIIMDTTNGFLKTGIIVIELPYEISNNNDILDKEYYWIRASVKNNIHVTSHILDVTAQVITATIEKPETLNDKYPDQVLPAQTIKRSVKNISGIQKISQPLDSFQGVAKETSKQYYTRVSERLRHRQRAIQPWDFERLVLDEFHEIEKITCLPNINSRYGKSGNVLLVVSPKSESSLSPNEPMVNNETLYQIKSFMKKFVSPFITVETRNPAYERVKVICAVSFNENHNYGFYLQKLKDDINYFILGNNKGNYVELQGSINVSDITSYIKSLPYINFITKFSMVQTAVDLNGNHLLIDTARTKENHETLEATQPWSALVPSSNHQIEVISTNEDKNYTQAGITDLELGQDFIID